MKWQQFWFGIFKEVLLPAFVTAIVLLAPATLMPKWAAVAYVTLVTGLVATLVWQTVINNNSPRWLRALGF